jgi:hypothetical protein
MTSRQQIARQAAKAAALSTYNAILNAPTHKVAGTNFRSAPSWKDIAKIAGASSYDAVAKLAQVMQMPTSQVVPLDFHSISDVMQRVSPDFYKWIVDGATTEVVPYDAKGFAAYVKTPGGNKETWATPETWPEVVRAITSNVAPQSQEGLKTYLLSL